MSHKGCIIIYTPHYNTVSSHACSEYSKGMSPSSQHKWHFVVGCASGKESTCQCRKCKRHGFHPWVGKIPWRRAWQPTPIFLPGESHRQRSLEGYTPQGRRAGHSWSDLVCTWLVNFFFQSSFYGTSKPLNVITSSVLIRGVKSQAWEWDLCQHTVWNLSDHEFPSPCGVGDLFLKSSFHRSQSTFESEERWPGPLVIFTKTCDVLK